MDMIVKFNKPYCFEGEMFTELDMSGLEDITGKDLVMIQGKLGGSSAASLALPEMTTEFACMVAARATKKPIEFFWQMPGREVVKVRNRVSAFFMNEDSEQMTEGESESLQ